MMNLPFDEPRNSIARFYSTQGFDGFSNLLYLYLYLWADTISLAALTNMEFCVVFFSGSLVVILTCIHGIRLG
ncbi:hypothetical protein QT972_16750 [Microcoleus sp. herbarium7]